MTPRFSIDNVTGLPRIELARLPTPFEPAPRLALAIGLRELHIKREDLSGHGLGGNKLRQLDFLLAEALATGADMLIATAGSQSNLCRSLAGAAAKLGLGCHLHLRAKMGTERVGNLMLDHIFGATVTFTQNTDPWDPAIRAELDEIAANHRATGRTPYIVQLTGTSASTSVAGWISGAAELRDDFVRLGREPHAVVAVCGSGLSLAGIALGLKHFGCSTRAIGISAQQPEARLRTWITDTANQVAERLGFETRLAEDDFDIIDTEIGPGYGIPSESSVAAVRLAGRTEGLVLDPIYTGKGIAALHAAVGDGRIDPDWSVVFVHSGGAPGLFTHATSFASDRDAAS